MTVYREILKILTFQITYLSNYLWILKCQMSKVIFSTFFDVRGIVHREFFSEGQTINQQDNKEILRPMICSLHEKRRESLLDKSWLFHHFNASSNKTLRFRQFLAQRNIAVLEQPDYLHDLARAIFSFPQTLGNNQENLTWSHGGHQKNRNHRYEKIPRESIQREREGRKKALNSRGLLKTKSTHTHTHTHIYIYIYMYIYILLQYMVVTISLGEFVIDQMRCNLESAQYLW